MHGISRAAAPGSKASWHTAQWAPPPPATVTEGIDSTAALEAGGRGAGGLRGGDGLRGGGGDAAAESERAADLDGGGRGLHQLVRGPVEEAVQVAAERDGVAEDVVRVRTVVRGRRGRCPRR